MQVKKLSDEFSRWWPADWYRYSHDSMTNSIIFGDRVLFRPSISPDSTKYIRWRDEIKLGDDDVILSGPFNFEKMSSTNRTRSKLAGVEWSNLHGICSSEGLLPPTTGYKTYNKIVPIKMIENPGKGNTTMANRRRRGQGTPIICLFKQIHMIPQKP